jgi:hypothetical protein
MVTVWLHAYSFSGRTTRHYSSLYNKEVCFNSLVILYIPLQNSTNSKSARSVLNTIIIIL